jgi:phosphatidylserine/phosphatidylglycerophosphate/cardiolipin synthase-like enzyme
MSSVLTVRTLTDGGQAPADVARELAAFLDAARSSLDVAVYDFALGSDTAALARRALEGAAARGVAVRMLYNVDHRAPIPVPPPPQGEPRLIDTVRVPTKGVAGVPDLMHHKYVVRDGASVWTGSTNWTDDSWSREENVVVLVDSPQLARAFTLDFEQLWTTGDVSASGKVEPRPVRVDGVEVRPWFTPGYGEELSHRIAKRIGQAKRRVRVASPVITAAPVLSTLAQVTSDAKVDLAGCVDATQVLEVLSQWRENGVAAWKIPLLRTILTGTAFSGKRSTKWGTSSTHDFMHAKVTVADDIVFVGSFNLSHSGERNAENVLEIRDAALADRMAAFVDSIRARYPAVELPPS